jgi:ATP-dependent DNA helicase RecG
MENWQKRAISLLNDSLAPIPTELNEIDWKSGLSPKTDRLAEHLSAFANQIGGGYFVFGVNDDGSLFSVVKQDADEIVRKLGNIANNNLNISIPLHHFSHTYNGYSLLFIYIKEAIEKPIYLRGKDIFHSYYRSGGRTEKMNRKQIQLLIAKSHGIDFESMAALKVSNSSEAISKLNYKSLFDLLEKKIPTTQEELFNSLLEYGLVRYDESDIIITMLGAILFARSIDAFPDILKHKVIVRKYTGNNNLNLESEQPSSYGYAVGFEGLIDYIMKKIPTTEVIQEAIRKNIPIFPKVAIREFVANALIHQDFTLEGMPISIEIFANRIEIINPGASLNDIKRLIDLPPRSRNEKLAEMMHLLHICEKRGSGVDRAIKAIEDYFLPPVKFQKGESFTKVVIYSKKEFKEMTKSEKINACYQHACLLHESLEEMTNQSLRERFRLNKNKTSVASRIISDTIEAGLIKPSDPKASSKKFTSYIPYYA